VPWQITENRKNTHCMMLMSEYTPKTYTVMHYSRFIRPGAQRIDAKPGFGDVQVGAFLHKESGEMAIITINPTYKEKHLNMTFKNLEGLGALKVYRTSTSENLQEAGEVSVNDNKTAFQMMPHSIVTFSGKISK
jgi:O-glycosyl hydrolase